MSWIPSVYSPYTGPAYGLYIHPSIRPSVHLGWLCATPPHPPFAPFISSHLDVRGVPTYSSILPNPTIIDRLVAPSDCRNVQRSSACIANPPANQPSPAQPLITDACLGFATTRLDRPLCRLQPRSTRPCSSANLPLRQRPPAPLGRCSRFSFSRAGLPSTCRCRCRPARPWTWTWNLSCTAHLHHLWYRLWYRPPWRTYTRAGADAAPLGSHITSARARPHAPSDVVQRQSDRSGGISNYRPRPLRGLPHAFRTAFPTWASCTALPPASAAQHTPAGLRPLATRCAEEEPPFRTRVDRPPLGTTARSVGKRRSLAAPAATRRPLYHYRLLPSCCTTIAGTTTGNLRKNWNGSGDGEMRSVHANDLAPTPLDDGRLQLRSPRHQLSRRSDRPANVSHHPPERHTPVINLQL